MNDLGSFLVRDLMNSAPTTVSEDTPLEKVASLMSVKLISCVIVVNQDGPIGIISERDIVKVVANDAKNLPELVAGDVMSHPLITVEPTTPVVDALNLMREKRFRRFPVVDAQGKLVGVLTQTDLLKPLLG